MTAIPIFDSSQRYKVNKVVSFDLYRDGGSISMTYVILGSDNGFELLFQVKGHELNRESNLEICYYDPIIEITIPNLYKCGITGREIPDSIKYRTNTSWQEAGYILKEAKEIIGVFQSDDLFIFDKMVDCVGKKCKINRIN